MIIKPAKELALLLQTRVILEKAFTEYPSKHYSDMQLHQHYLVSNEKGLFKSGYGPAIISSEEFTLTKEEAFENLANKIKEYERARFNLLWLPITPAVDHVAVDINSNVIIRIIEYYEIMSDEIHTRYDVLIQKYPFIINGK